MIEQLQIPGVWVGRVNTAPDLLFLCGHADAVALGVERIRRLCGPVTLLASSMIDGEHLVQLRCCPMLIR